ncbi:MAG: PIN domain-containing protein [Nitrosomonadaceae bacterium]|nr:PIN domain-containing protein [Nitrosomonadaceae bacterium]
MAKMQSLLKPKSPSTITVDQASAPFTSTAPPLNGLVTPTGGMDPSSPRSAQSSTEFPPRNVTESRGQNSNEVKTPRVGAVPSNSQGLNPLSLQTLHSSTRPYYPSPTPTLWTPSEQRGFSQGDPRSHPPLTPSLHSPGMLLALPAFSTDLTQRNKVMEAMTQQRLQSEITRVQSAVAVIAKQPSLLAAVLIPDALTLANNKQLLDEINASMALFVVIPLVVMANLDKLKVGNQRVHKGARDVTHVIQAAMAAYNPYIRVQYPVGPLPCQWTPYHWTKM